MSILIEDPQAREREAEEYEAAVEKALRGQGDFPASPLPTAAELEYARGVVSSEGVTRGFHRGPVGMLGGYAAPIADPAPPLDESPKPRPAPQQDTPFKLGGK